MVNDPRNWLHPFWEFVWLYITQFLEVSGADNVWNIWTWKASCLHLLPVFFLKKDQTTLLLLFSLSHLFFEWLKDDFTISMRVHRLRQYEFLFFNLRYRCIFPLFSPSLFHIVWLAIWCLSVILKVSLIQIILWVGYLIELWDVSIRDIRSFISLMWIYSILWSRLNINW